MSRKTRSSVLRSGRGKKVEDRTTSSLPIHQVFFPLPSACNWTAHRARDGGCVRPECTRSTGRRKPPRAIGSRSSPGRERKTGKLECVEPTRDARTPGRLWVGAYGTMVGRGVGPLRLGCIRLQEHCKNSKARGLATGESSARSCQWPRIGGKRSWKDTRAAEWCEARYVGKEKSQILNNLTYELGPVVAEESGEAHDKVCTRKERGRVLA